MANKKLEWMLDNNHGLYRIKTDLEETPTLDKYLLVIMLILKQFQLEVTQNASHKEI